MTPERQSRSITVSAKTVADAIAEAEMQLGLPRDEIDITVLSEGSKGFLGMGSENARIIAMPKAILIRRSLEPQHAAARVAAPPIEPEEPLVLDEPEEDYAPEPLETPRSEPPRPVPVADVAEEYPLTPLTATVDAPVAGDDDESEHDDEHRRQPTRIDPAAVAEVAVEVVRELVLRMGIEAVATVRSTGNPVMIDIKGDDLGLLIGRHGETLSSLQYMVNAIVGKRVNRWCKVIVDVEHYRQRREESLRALANRQAARVRQSNQELLLDPMPAAERRVVHMTLQNSPFVVTNSVGDEPNRRVVIAPRQGPR